MKKLPTLVFLLSMGMALAPLFAVEDISILRSIFIPSSFYVGDTVELRLTFQTPSEKLRVAEALPQPDWGVLHGITLQEHDGIWDARIRFTPFAPGTLALPSIPLGSVSLEGLIVHVHSVLTEDGRELAALRPQVQLPQTWVSIIGQVLLLLVLIFFAWWSWVFFRPVLTRFIRLRQERKPARKIRRLLHDMKTALDDLEAPELYGHLIHEARLYFSDRLKIPAISATSRELLLLLADTVPDLQSFDLLTELFSAADRVRFAGADIPKDGRAHHIEAMFAIIEQVEGALVPRERLVQTDKGVVHVDA